MELTKGVELLLQKAEKKGEAVKKIRESQILHRKSVTNNLVNQWKMKIQNDILIVEHYDTKIAEIDRKNKKILYVYGESQTDAMVINGLCHKYGIDDRFSFSRKHKTFEKK